MISGIRSAVELEMIHVSKKLVLLLWYFFKCSDGSAECTSLGPHLNSKRMNLVPLFCKPACTKVMYGTVQSIYDWEGIHQCERELAIMIPTPK